MEAWGSKKQGWREIWLMRGNCRCMFVTLLASEILKVSFGRVQWGWRSCMALCRLTWHWMELSQALEQRCSRITETYHSRPFPTESIWKFWPFEMHLLEEESSKRWEQTAISREMACWHWEFILLLKKNLRLRNVIDLHNAYFFSLKYTWKEVETKDSMADKVM